MRQAAARAAFANSQRHRVSDRYGPHAVRLYAIAARALGWSPHLFWAATPTELADALQPPGDPDGGLDRAGLNRLMDIDNG